MKIRSVPKLQNFPGISGKLVVDTFRGQIRVRKWPRKQSATTKRKNGNQIRWFKASRQMAKFAEANQQKIAIEATKGTGLYPGDLLMMASAGNFYQEIVASPENYTKWKPEVKPMSFQGARLTYPAIQTLVANVPTIMIWGLPSFQTSAFWDPGAPTLITIPPGITKINLGASSYVGASGNPEITMQIETGAGGIWARNLTLGRGLTPCQIQTGPIATVEGDTWRVSLTSDNNNTAQISQALSFWCQVLEAT